MYAVRWPEADGPATEGEFGNNEGIVSNACSSIHRGESWSHC